MGDSIIVVEGLRKAYGDVIAVTDVSFRVRRGEIFGLLGPHGAGTTTVIECLQGLRIPDAGRVRVLDLDPMSQLAQLRGRIGGHLQGSTLPGRIRVGEALRLFMSLNGRRRGWRDLMSRFELAGVERMFFEQLTDQERLRLELALALAGRPEIVFLDDTTTGLGLGARRRARELVWRVRAAGATVVMATHDPGEAHHVCDRVAMFDDGRLVAVDSAAGRDVAAAWNVVPDIPRARRIGSIPQAEVGRAGR